MSMWTTFGGLGPRSSVAQGEGVTLLRPAYLGELAYNPANGLLYASNDGNFSAAVIDPKSASVVANVRLTGFPWGIAFSSTLDEAFVGNSSGTTISVFNYKTDALVSTINAQVTTSGIAFDPANGRLYAASATARSVQVIDPASRSVVATVMLPTIPEEILYDPSNGMIYVGLYGTSLVPGEKVAVVDPSTNSVVKTIPVGYYPQGLGYDAVDGYVLSLGSSSGNLAVIKDSTDSVVANVTLGSGSGPFAVAFDSGNGMAYVSLSSENKVAVVSLSTFSVATTIPVAPVTQGITFDPGTGNVYVASTSGFVQIIDTTSNAVSGTIGASPLTVGYSVFGEPGYAPLQLSFMQNGVLTKSPVPPGGLHVYADSGSTWAVQQVLNGSQASRRWATNGVTSGVVGPPELLNFTYYEQVPIYFGYSAAGGSPPQPPSIRGVEFGKAASLPADSASWVDRGTSYQYPGTLQAASSSVERWALTGNGSGVALSAGSVNQEYYHQFSYTISYRSVGMGFVPSPTLTMTYFGNVTSTKLPNPLITSQSSYWMDAGKSWSVTNPIPAGTAGERWYSARTASGTVANAASLNLTYQLQYQLSVAASPTNGGSVSPDGGWYAPGTTVELAATPASGWRLIGWNVSAGAPSSGQATNESVTLLSPTAVVAQFSLGVVTTTTPAGGGGIPEFPGQVVATAMIAVLIAAAYLAVRRQKSRRTLKG